MRAEAKLVLEGMLERLGVDYMVREIDLDGQPMLGIDSADHALLIGHQGENLAALQYLFNLVLRRKVDDFEFTPLDVADYKRARLEKVFENASEAVKQFEETGQPVKLKPMRSFERRLIHMRLADHPNIVTESYGEEPHRGVIIKAREV